MLQESKMSLEYAVTIMKPDKLSKSALCRSTTVLLYCIPLQQQGVCLHSWSACSGIHVIVLTNAMQENNPYSNLHAGSD